MTLPRPIRWIPLAASLALLTAMAVCYAARPDGCAAVTVFPPWVWPVPGLGLAAFHLRGPGRRWGWAAVAAWAAFGLGFADEPRSLARGLIRAGRPWRADRAPGGTVRVVSLNCAIGSRPAADEVAAYHPDVVLLQESPNRPAVEDLARRLFGADAGVAYGVDASLIVRGRAVAADLTPAERGYLVQAWVTLAGSGREVEVVSTRLVPTVFRFDLWAPDCWREQAANRRARRDQLRAIARRVGAARVPVLVGGDFNAPQGDGAMDVLRPKLRDAFDAAGLGWGNTIVNDVPALRIDQVWVGRGIRPDAVVARRTRNSDHRMVICDLSLDAAPRPDR